MAPGVADISRYIADNVFTMPPPIPDPSPLSHLSHCLVWKERQAKGIFIDISHPTMTICGSASAGNFLSSTFLLHSGNPHVDREPMGIWFLVSLRLGDLMQTLASEWQNVQGAVSGMTWRMTKNESRCDRMMRDRCLWNQRRKIRVGWYCIRWIQAGRQPEDAPRYIRWGKHTQSY